MTGLRQRTEGRRRMGLLLAGLLFFLALPSFAIQRTTIRDTVYRADGTVAQGTVLVSWPGFTAADGSTVAAGSTTVALAADGSLNLVLAPNAGASPQGTYYTVVYHLTDGTVQKEYWVVPTGNAVTVTQIRAQVVPAAVAQQMVSKQYVDSALQTSEARYLPLTGGSMSGVLSLSADPTSNLQATTKQYVDTRTSLAGVVSDFSISTTSTRTVFATSFNEGAAGASLAGTAPATGPAAHLWVEHDNGAHPWVFQSGGGVTAAKASTQPANGPTFDLGVSDYTLHLNVTSNGGQYMMVMLRYVDTGDVIFVNLNGGQATPYSYINGQATALGAGISADFTSLAFMLSGTSLTITSGTNSASYTIPGSVAGFLTSTLWGFSLENGANAVIASASATVPTVTTSACSGVMEGDGSCGPIVANEGVATDGNGHVAALAEHQYATDSKGKVTIACSEDHSNGIFDPRCSVYGNGGVNGPNPAQAWQDVADAANCWTGTHGRMATINAPPGSWQVGLQSEPTLTFGPVNFHGAAGGEYGATSFRAGYTNVTTVQFITPYTSPCPGLGLPAGTLVTNGFPGGAVTNVTQHGCSTGGCSSLASDSGDPLNQLNQKGIFVGWVHSAEIGPLYAEYNRSTGITIDGLDVLEKGGLFSYSNNGFLQLDHGGSTYDPTTDGMHYDVELTSGDSRFFHIETYGFLATPGKEAGHVASIGLEGGNVYLEDIFPQLGQIGLMRPYGGGFARVHGMRIDGMGLNSLVNQDPASTFVQGLFDGFCGANTLPNQCDSISATSSDPASFAHINITRSSFFGAVHPSGDILSSYKQHFEDITADSGAPVFETGLQPGEGVSYKQADFAALDGGLCQTGAHLSVNNLNHVHACNASPTQILDAPDGLVNQDLWITLESANDVLTSQANGGIWKTNTGLNVAGPGYFHFTITRSGTAVEQGDSINAAYWTVGHAGLAAEPAVWTNGVLDAAGSAAVRALPALTDGNVQGVGSQSGYQYCFEEMVYVAGGKQSNHPSCTGVTPPASELPQNNVFYHGSLPLNWTRYKVYLESTTDPAFSAMVGLLFDQTASAPQLPVSDLKLAITSGMTPISTSVIPASGQGVNMTGTYNVDTTGAPAASSSPCVPGQVKEVPGLPTGYTYYCDSEDHWIRETTTWATF